MHLMQLRPRKALSITGLQTYAETLVEAKPNPCVWGGSHGLASAESPVTWRVTGLRLAAEYIDRVL